MSNKDFTEQLLDLIRTGKNLTDADTDFLSHAAHKVENGRLLRDYEHKRLARIREKAL